MPLHGTPESRIIDNLYEMQQWVGEILAAAESPRPEFTHVPALTEKLRMLCMWTDAEYEKMGGVVPRSAFSPPKQKRTTKQRKKSMKPNAAVRRARVQDRSPTAAELEDLHLTRAEWNGQTQDQRDVLEAAVDAWFDAVMYGTSDTPIEFYIERLEPVIRDSLEDATDPDEWVQNFSGGEYDTRDYDWFQRRLWDQVRGAAPAQIRGYYAHYLRVWNIQEDGEEPPYER